MWTETEGLSHEAYLPTPYKEYPHPKTEPARRLSFIASIGLGPHSPCAIIGVGHVTTANKNCEVKSFVQEEIW